MEPTQAGFLAFIRNGMGITTTYLPDNSVWIGYAYTVAVALVNPQIQQACYIGAPVMYELAVYNLAAHNLICFAQDVPGVTVDNPKLPPAQIGYFALLRQQFGTNQFTAGTVVSSGDEGDSVTLATVDGLKNLTASQLGLLKTPYGIIYLGIAQSVGSLVGLT